MEKQFIKERIEDKMKQIEQFLQELSEIKSLNFEQYEQDIKTKAACERYGEKIPEAFVDLALLTIKYLNLPAPKDEDNAFEILEQNHIIDSNLCKNLKNSKSMRNFIAHEYGKVDDRIVFEATSRELEQDGNKFIRKIMEEVK